MTPTELYALHFDNPEPKYYTRIPHIVDHLTYDDIDEKTGKNIIKRLSIYAIQLYRIIRVIAGEHGACWQNRDKLAELANMSVGSVTKAKEELQKNFHQLNGNPLIRVEEAKKSNNINGTKYHKIFITDIWRWNNAFMATLPYHKNTAPSPHDGADEAPSPHDGAPQGAPSPGDTNNNNNNKNPLFKEQQPTACQPIVCSFESKTRLFALPSHKKSYDYLISQGCHEATSYGIAKKYSAEDLSKALEYVNRINAKSPVKNRLGYLQTVIKNRYWETRSERNTRA